MTMTTNPDRRWSQTTRIGVALIPGVIIGTVWVVVAGFDLVSDRLLPGPVDVLTSMWQLVNRAYFWENLWITLRVVGIAMVLSTIGGIALGSAIATVPTVRDGVYHFVVGLNILPKVALVPLLTVTIGSNSRSRVVIVVLVAFFPVFVNVLTAIREANVDRIRLMRSLEASRLQRLRFHLLPEGAPAIFAGLKLSLTIAFLGTILTEFLIRRDGLAYLITSFQATLNTSMMFATTIMIAALGVVAYQLIERAERRLVFWVDDAQGGRS